MKLLSIICLILLSIALVQAHYGCNNVPCGPGRICLKLRGSCSCVEIPHCREVTLTLKKIGEWTTNGKCYSQYDVVVTNYLDFDIKEIFIGTDETFRLHGENIWNVKRCSNSELTLPDYQNSINSKASYTFGFILCGATTVPNLQILAVTY